MSHYVRVKHDEPHTPPATPPDGGAPQPERRYAIGELAELGGVSRRTVRYYVTRELVPPPTGVGRGAYYTDDHLERLIRVRDLQAAGVPLNDIARHLDGDGAPAAPVASDLTGPTPEGTRWTRLVVADGVELHVREGALADDALTTLARLLARHAPPTTPAMPMDPTGGPDER